MRTLAGISSTNRILGVAIAADGSEPELATASAIAGARRSGSWMVKVEPRATWLITSMVPPMASTKALTIASPRPAPPNLRVIVASPCSNFPKMALSFSVGMPMPVSSMTKIRSSTSGWRVGLQLISTLTLPCSVNLTAFPHRLRSICFIREGSPRNSRSLMQAQSLTWDRARPFASAWTPRIWITSATTCRASNWT